MSEEELKPIGARIDEVVAHLEQEEDVRLDNFHKKSEGLGDTLQKVFAKFGLTEENIQEAAGLGGCGCHKRKKFLNKIFPYRKTAEPVAKKKED